MRGGALAPAEAGRTLKLTLSACALLAAAAVVVSTFAGHWLQGLALGAGLLLGGLNGYAIQASLGAEAGFRATSMVRLAVLTALAIGAGLLLGSGLVWPVLGVGLAEVVLALGAAREAVRR